MYSDLASAVMMLAWRPDRFISVRRAFLTGSAGAGYRDVFYRFASELMGWHGGLLVVVPVSVADPFLSALGDCGRLIALCKVVCPYDVQRSHWNRPRPWGGGDLDGRMVEWFDGDFGVLDAVERGPFDAELDAAELAGVAADLAAEAIAGALPDGGRVCTSGGRGPVRVGRL